ncbi:MAG: hypothetical protein ACI92Z_001598 [Paracoccaceae bacterium]|jgi:hypothetical protein
MFQCFSLCLRFLRLVLIVSLVLCTPVFAQDYGGAGNGNQTSPGGLSTRTTNKVIRHLDQGIQKCRKLEKIYRYDCYRVVYHLAASQMNGKPDYAQAQAALVTVERTLEQIVARNRDPNPPKPNSKNRKFTPIKPTTVRKSAVQFNRALDTAETALLRSSDQSQVHFARIAAAVQSNKVLLRS